MAPIEEVYFPPLDRCLSGKHHLLSWETAYVAISQLDRNTHHGILRTFITDPQTKKLLANALSPYSSPSSKSKSTFETKISAINNISPNDTSYDIQEIQDDSLWLSKTVSIDELSALRIVVLEWQTRSARNLLKGASSEHTANPIQSLVLDARSSLLSNSSQKEAEGSESIRDKRRKQTALLRLYMSERVFLLKTSEYLLAGLLCKAKLTKVHVGSLHQETDSTWLDEVGEAIYFSWKAGDSHPGKTKRPGIVITIVDAIRSRIDDFFQGCKWPGIEDLSEDVSGLWAQNRIVETIHVVQIMLWLLQLSDRGTETEHVVAWFRLMDETSLFEKLSGPIEWLQQPYDLPLQSLAVLVTLAILDVSPTLQFLTEASASGVLSTDSADTSPYIFHPSTASEINDIVINLSAFRVSSPIALAWSIICQTVREMALAAKEAKETRQALRAADRYGAAESSDTDGVERINSRSTPPLRRRTSNSSDTSLQMTLVEEVYDAISVTNIDGDPIAYLALSAVQNENVFDVVATIASEYCTAFGFEHDAIPAEKMRNILLDLLRVCVDFVIYQPSLINAIIAVLTGFERFWDLLERPIIPHNDQPSTLFIRDPALRYKFLLRAASRFPYESIAFLQICRALGFQYTNSSGDLSVPWINLEELDIFTCKLPPTFTALTPIREDEEGDYIQLTDSLDVVVGSKETNLLAQNMDSIGAINSSSESLAVITIPADTSGVIQSETKPFVIGWNHQYSGLEYIGKILLSASSSGATSGQDRLLMSQTIVAEAIYLLNVLLASAIKNPWAQDDTSKSLESAHSILGQASNGLSQNQDIVSVVLDILENELYSVQQASPNDVSMDVLAHCVEFMHLLLELMPDRVWPFLGKSALLGVGKDEPQFSSILSQEMALGRYSFLLGCIRLYSALIEDAVSHAVSRRAPPKALIRFGSTEKMGSGLSLSTMQSILLNFSRFMIDVFESSNNWKFSAPSDRMEINHRLCETFGTILIYCYTVDDQHNVSEKVTNSLGPAAACITEAFLSTSNNDFIVKPLLNIFATAIHTQTSTLGTFKDRFELKQTISALNLTSTLIEANVYLKRPTSYLEGQLFDSALLLAKIYAAHQSHGLSVLRLFNRMLLSASRSAEQPPSLLGHLGPQESSFFLDILAQLDQPLQNQALSVEIWALLTTIVSRRQQWFAMYVLTGKTPRASLRKTSDKATTQLKSRVPILKVAIEQLISIDSLESEKALAMLKFVAVSADFWPWALTSIDAEPKFLEALSGFVARAGFYGQPSHRASQATLPKYMLTEMLALVVRILATYTHYKQQTNDQKFSRGLVPQLNYLIEFAITAPEYNNSLHSNLRHNFEEKYPACRLADLKKTDFRQSLLGDSFCYDINLAEKMLSFEPAWHGRKNNGFAEEFRRANVNLSLVEAENNLFISWKFLILELSGVLSTEPKFQDVMAIAATACLRINANNTLPQAIFRRLSMSRADLAFTLLQRLVEVKSSRDKAKGVLEVAWSTVLSHADNLESAFTGDEADYHRMLQRILYLALQLHIQPMSIEARRFDVNTKGSPTNYTSSTTATTVLPLVYEILSRGIAGGFRSLTILLHTSPQLVQSSDLSLITALLRSCLQVPGLERDSSRLLTAFSDSQTARSAATLLSWSDRIAASSSNDPILGELAIDFLVELSTQISLAESLAVDGVLSQILSTNVIRVLQSRAFSPLDVPRRMYTIWARGMLPLMLNLLNAIGPPIAPEITAALNMFPHQLHQASNAFALNSRGPNISQDTITLTMATEAHNLALITGVLDAFREAGASAGILARDIGEVKWDSNQVMEDVEGWLQARSSLRTKITATSTKEESWARRKPSHSESLCESLLEQKVVEELTGVIGVLAGPSET